MTAPAPSQPPDYHAGIPERLAAEGLPAATAAALLDFDTTLFLWQRIWAKGEVPGRLIADLGLDLELSQFYALAAIHRIGSGIGRPGPEPATIGLLASEMNIDPSRASRIASDLVAKGYLRRELVQADGRKTVLVLTDRALTAFAAFRDRRWDKMLDLFRDWPAGDIERFAALFRRYADGVRAVYQTDG